MYKNCRCSCLGAALVWLAACGGSPKQSPETEEPQKESPRVDVPLAPTPMNQKKEKLAQARAAIEELISAAKPLRDISDLMQKAEFPLSNELRQEIMTLSQGLPRYMQSDIDFDTSDPGKWRAFAQKWAKKFEFKHSKDLGGHGGTFLLNITVQNGDTHYLFLKPVDEVEERNYRIIQELAPQLSTYMPDFYGVIHWHGSSYLVLQNINQGPKGESLTPLLDIKLAGKLPKLSDFNPIADQEEMMTTRGQKKSWFDYNQQNIGAQSSPGYMIAHGDIKSARILHYKNSQRYLLDALKKTSPQALRSLIGQLKGLRQTLTKSPLALIGSSVLLLEGPGGTLKAMLIDPAHLQVDPQLSSKDFASIPRAQVSKIYFGSPQNYEDRKASNGIAFEAIINAISSLVLPG